MSAAAPSLAAPQRLVVGISGSSGAIYGLRLLHALKSAADLEVHLVITPTGWLNLRHETGISDADALELAHTLHASTNLAASIASGSFRTLGMVVAPCSMRTLAAIAHGLGDNLLTRAADVTLKERRRLILMTRESPLSLIHLRNMAAATEAGAIVCPPAPAFYQRPASVEELVDHSVARVLDLLDLPQQLAPPWPGLKPERKSPAGKAKPAPRARPASAAETPLPRLPDWPGNAQP